MTPPLGPMARPETGNADCPEKMLTLTTDGLKRGPAMAVRDECVESAANCAYGRDAAHAMVEPTSV
jgi:hypothetical protein